MPDLSRVWTLRSSSAAGTGAGASPRARRLALLAKGTVTALCFMYLARRIDWPQVLRATHDIGPGWVLLAVAAFVAQVLLASLRWSKIVDGLGRGTRRIDRVSVLAISAIATFFAQVMPNVASEGIRAWMLTRLDVSWQRALGSVLIDRAIGVAALVAVGLLAMLAPSRIGVAAGVRGPLIESFAAVLAAGAGGLLLAPVVGPHLQAWRYTRWLGRLAQGAHEVILGTRGGAFILALAVMVQLLALLTIWLVGHSLGLSFQFGDVGMLFVAVFVPVLLPISIGGWGVRELAVTALLGADGIPVERALLFSVLFGLCQLAAGLPGAAIWLLYAPQRFARIGKD